MRSHSIAPSELDWLSVQSVGFGWVGGLDWWGLKFKIWGFNHEIWGLGAKNWGLDTKSACYACQGFTIRRLNTPLGQQAWFGSPMLSPTPPSLLNRVVVGVMSQITLGCLLTSRRILRWDKDHTRQHHPRLPLDWWHHSHRVMFKLPKALFLHTGLSGLSSCHDFCLPASAFSVQSAKKYILAQ